MTDFETVEVWKNRLDLSDEDILTQQHLNRVATQPPAQESEIIYCACGCGGFWLRPLNYKGRNFRYIRGHAPKKDSKKGDSPPRRDQREIIKSIFKALPTEGCVNTAATLAKKIGVGRETVLRNLGIIDLILSLQSGHWLERVGVQGVKDVTVVYRRKPRKRGEKREGS